MSTPTRLRIRSAGLSRYIVLALALVAGCGPGTVSNPATRETVNGPPAHEVTEIPIDFNTLTEDQKALIRLENAADPTPYLMRSRPTVCQIVETGNAAHEVRRAGPITERAEVMIYALGEAAGDRLVDYGWLENASTGDVVWEMTLEASVHGGGDPRNRKAVETLWLEPGSYELHYVTNDSHALGDWRGAPPERELFYGVVVFNLAAIRSIDARFEEAGIAVD